MNSYRGIEYTVKCYSGLGKFMFCLDFKFKNAVNSNDHVDENNLPLLPVQPHRCKILKHWLAACQKSSLLVTKFIFINTFLRFGLPHSVISGQTRCVHVTIEGFTTHYTPCTPMIWHPC